jgi:hypothetical protein
MRARLVLVPIVVAVALVAGCDKSGPDPAASASPSAAPSDNGVALLPAGEILSKALAAASSAESFHVKGDLKIDGDTLGIDLVVSGRNGKGSITAEGHTVELIKVSDEVYFKAGEGFWNMVAGDNQQPAIAALLKDRWVKVPADEGFAEMANLFDPDNLLPSAGPATKGETKTINGISAIGLTDSTDTGEAVIYVATQGEPYPLRLEGPPGEGAIDFTDWNAPVEITAPPAAEVLDMSQIS